VRDVVAEADIDCPADAIFDLITDLRGQDRWLTTSSPYRGTIDISQNPAVLGTTYREPGPLGVRHGTVIEYERPTKITFHQPMTMRFHSGVVDVILRYTLVPRGDVTHVERRVALGIPWQVIPIRSTIERAFSTESARTLLALKAYADKLE